MELYTEIVFCEVVDDHLDLGFIPLCGTSQCRDRSFILQRGNHSWVKMQSEMLSIDLLDDGLLLMRQSCWWKIVPILVTCNETKKFFNSLAVSGLPALSISFIGSCSAFDSENSTNVDYW